MATTSLTEEEKNFTKFFLLNFKVSPEITRRFFDTIFPPSRICQTINNNIHAIVNLSKRGPINSAQLTILRGIPGTRWPSNLPPIASGAQPTSSKDFDLTLMICLLRNLSGLPRPINGWDQLPHPNDLSSGAHLATLKWYRNEMAHTTVSSMDSNEFSDKWTRVDKALIDLNSGQMPQEVSDVLNLDLDGEVTRAIAEAEITELKQENLDCKTKQQQIESDYSNYRVGQFPKTTADMVERWKEDDMSFYETTGAKHLYDKIKDFNCIVVTSSSGYGKTAAIRHIALKLLLEGFDIQSFNTPDSIINYAKYQKKRVFVFEDVLGKYQLNPILLANWERLNEKLNNCLNYKLGSLKVLCTLRNHIALDKRFENASSILNEVVINLESESIALSDDERRNILFRHLEENQNKIPEEEVNKLCESNNAFPLMCRLILNDEKRFNRRTSFFRRPLSLLREELDEVCAQNKTLYCALVLCMLYNGRLISMPHVVSRMNDEKIGRIMRACDLQTNMSKIELYYSALSAVGIYFTYDSYRFRFIHDVLEETVGYHFSRLDSRILFKECDISFIRDRVHVHSNDKLEENIVTIQEEQLEQSDLTPIYERLFNELDNGRFSNVLRSPLLKNKEFVRIFTTVINDRSTTSIYKLLRCMSDEREKIKFGNCAYSRVTGAVSFRSTLMYWIIAFGCNEFFQRVWGELKINEKQSFLGKDYLLVPSVKSLFPLAVLGGSIDIVSSLISDGADVNCFSELWETPLFIATRTGRHDMVDILVRNKAKINICGWFDMKVPIHVTINQPDLTSLLLKHDSKQTELHVAIRNNDLVKLRISIQSSNIDSKTNSGWTPLHYAVALKNVQAVEVLFDEFLSPDNDSIGLNHDRKLLSKIKKPDVNMPDNNGLTPIHLAILTNDIDTLTVLLRNKVDDNVRDNYGRTPLHYTRSLRATKALLAYHNKCSETDLENGYFKTCYNNPMTALKMNLSNLTFLTIFRCFFRDFLNMQDQDGNTVLHFVTMNPFLKAERDDTVKLLLQNGANPLLYNDKNETAFQLIKNNGGSVETSNEHTEHVKQPTNNTVVQVLTFVMALVFIILMSISTALPFIFSIKENGTSYCSTDNLQHFNESRNIDLVRVRSTLPDLILTILLFWFLSILTQSFKMIFVKLFLIFTLGCILFILAFPFVSKTNLYNFMFRSVLVAVSFTLYTHTICNGYYYISLVDLSRLKFFHQGVMLFCESITVVVLSIYALRCDVGENINKLVINVANCTEINITNITCVGLGYNETFQNGHDFSVICNANPNITASDKLVVTSENSWSDIFEISLFYLNFLFHAMCVYFFLHFMYLLVPSKRKQCLRIFIVFLPPIVIFMIVSLYLFYSLTIDQDVNVTFMFLVIGGTIGGSIGSHCSTTISIGGMVGYMFFLVLITVIYRNQI